MYIYVHRFQNERVQCKIVLSETNFSRIIRYHSRVDKLDCNLAFEAKSS